MKNSIKSIFLIGIGMLLIIVANFFFPGLLSNNKELILLIAALILVKITVGIDLKRDSSDKVIIKNVLIYVLVYYIIIYLAGLFIGFNKTIFSFSLSNLLKNILPTLVCIIVSEIIRNQMIKKSDKNIKVSIMTFLVFTLLEISVNFRYYDFSISDDVYQYFGLIVIGSISKNILLTILNNKTDVYPGIIYRLLMEIPIYVVFIVPALGPYLTSVTYILLPTLISVMIINTSKRNIKDKPKDKNKKGIIFTVVTILLLIVVLLNTGLLKYQIMVVGSNSMKPKIYKGDVIFVERLRKDDRNNVEVGEVLVFKYDNKIINHRVVDKVERNGKIYYETKGDANDQRDGALIDKEKVLGKTLFRIKYIGLPSIWLNELFN